MFKRKLVSLIATLALIIIWWFFVFLNLSSAYYLLIVGIGVAAIGYFFPFLLYANSLSNRKKVSSFLKTGLYVGIGFVCSGILLMVSVKELMLFSSLLILTGSVAIASILIKERSVEGQG